jgi:8-amino-7-oxononanoate synthase
MESLFEKLKRKMDARRLVGNFRTLPPPAAGLVDFASNDYLGLARDQSIAAALAALSPAHGAAGSRLLSGNSSLAETLEAELAGYHHAEAALLYPSGYAANMGLIGAVADRHDAIYHDELAHASIRDALRLVPTRSFSFRHNDLSDLERKMARPVPLGGERFIVVESLYSMDGDEPPLEALVDLARAKSAALIVDEAHATGVFGPRGEGLCVEKGLESAVWARVHTFGKALGAHGAAVLGPAYLREYLVNFSRPFIYTTAMPEYALHTLRLAYPIMREGEARRRLRDNIALFHAALPEAARPYFTPARGPIQALRFPGNDAVKRLADHIRAAGLDVRPVLHPTVPKGAERLRICLHAYNTAEEIEGLTRLLGVVLERACSSKAR